MYLIFSFQSENCGVCQYVLLRELFIKDYTASYKLFKETTNLSAAKQYNDTNWLVLALT